MQIDEFIFMPHNLNALKQEFYDIAMMPNTIGAIDGTHVAITGLSKDIEHVYVNRKGWVHNFKICIHQNYLLNSLSAYNIAGVQVCPH